MSWKDYGFFTVREPSGDDPRILYFVNEAEEDWYDLRRELTEWDENGRYISAIYPTWAMVDKDGIVTNVEYDPSRLMPGDRRIIGTELNESSVKVGMKYSEGEFS